MEHTELNPKTARFDTRLSIEQKNYFERAARLGGFRNLTDFVILAVQEKAKEIIAENERTISTKKDAEIFFDAVMNPKSPNSALSNAAEDFKALFT